MTRSRSSGFSSSNITARIPLQSWKSLLAISMTASPREKRFRAPRRMAGRENPSIPAAEKTTGPAIVYLCHCEERSDVAIRSLSVPQRGTGGEKHRRDADCHVGLCPPRNDVVVLACLLIGAGGRRTWRAILESPLRKITKNSPAGFLAGLSRLDQVTQDSILTCWRYDRGR